MSDRGEELARSAARLVGSPFRFHGTNPDTGLDCVGLVASALSDIGVTPQRPLGYAMRNHSFDRFASYAEANGLMEVLAPIRAGDILLARPGPAQFHLLVAETHNQFVHAHASLRRVVRMPAPIPWPIVKHWRLQSELERQL